MSEKMAQKIAGHLLVSGSLGAEHSPMSTGVSKMITIGAENIKYIKKRVGIYLM